MARATFSQPSVRPKFSPSGKPSSPRTSAVLLGGGGLAMVIGAVLTFTTTGMKIIGGIHWFLEFYSGVFSLVALSITIMVGLAATDRIVLMVRHRVLLQAVHRAFATTSMVFLCIHIILKVLEGHASVVDVLIPFVAAHKVLYIGLGTIASYLMFLVTWTGIIRGRFAGSAHPWFWRAMHASAYLSWPVALVHGLEAGRHAKTWVTVSYAVCVILVALALLVRVCVSWGQRLRAPKAQTTGTIKAIGKPVSVSLPPQPVIAADPMPDPLLDEPMIRTTVLREATITPPPRRRVEDDPFGTRRAPRAIESRPAEIDFDPSDPGWRSYEDAPVSPAPRRGRMRDDGTMTGEMPRIRDGRSTGEIPRVRDSRTTGEFPRIRDGRSTGEIPRVRDSHTGDIPRVRDSHTGEIPRVRDSHTGDIPRVRDSYSSGELPRVRDGRSTGDIPRVRDSHTGEIPRVRDSHTGDIPRVRDSHTGDIPRVRDSYSSGEIPRVREGRSTGEIPRVRDSYGSGEIPRVTDDYADRGYRPMEDAADFPESVYPDRRDSSYEAGAHRSEATRSGTGAYPRVDRSGGGYQGTRRSVDDNPGYAPFDSRYTGEKYPSDDRYAADDRYAPDDRYSDDDGYTAGGFGQGGEVAYGHVMPPRSAGRPAFDDDRPGRRSRTDDMSTSGPLEPPVPDTPPRRRRSLAELTSAPADPPLPRRPAEEISDEEFWAHMRGEALR